MPAMQTIQLGEARIPRMGMGTWNLGRTAAEREQAALALRMGIEMGLSLVDTAEMYENESFLGTVLHPCREQVYLVSKVLPHHADRRGTVAACEASLRRLQTDYLDLYLLHWQGEVPLEESVAAFQALQAAGKIRAWGVSNIDTAGMKTLPDVARCATNQVLYNPQYRAAEYDLLPWMTQQRMPLMAYSPLGQGGTLLQHPTLTAVAEAHAATPAQVVLAWLLTRPAVIPIPKAGNAAHLRENIGAFQLQLTPADLAAIDTAFPRPRKKMPLVAW